MWGTSSVQVNLPGVISEGGKGDGGPAAFRKEVESTCMRMGRVQEEYILFEYIFFTLQSVKNLSNTILQSKDLCFLYCILNFVFGFFFDFIC